MFFTPLKIAFHAMRGTFRNDSYLKQNFKIYLVCWVVASGAVALSASQSWKFWAFQFGGSEVAGIAVTVAYALVSIILLGAVTSYLVMGKTIDELEDMEEDDNLDPVRQQWLEDLLASYPSRPVFLSIIAMTMLWIAGDCYANYTGGPKLAQELTQAYGEDRSYQHHDAWSQYLDGYKSKVNNIYEKYYWDQSVNGRSTWAGMWETPLSVQNFRFAAKPQYGISRGQFQADKKALETLRADSARTWQNYQASISNSTQEHQRDVQRYDAELRERTTFQKSMVFLEYLAAIIASAISGFYVSRADFVIWKWRQTRTKGFLSRLRPRQKGRSGKREEESGHISTKAPGPGGRKTNRRGQKTRQNIQQKWEEYQAQNVTPTPEMIAVDLGLSERQVSRVLAELGLAETEET